MIVSQNYSKFQEPPGYCVVICDFCSLRHAPAERLNLKPKRLTKPLTNRISFTRIR
ncbi:hypothetical protein AWB79_00226 [Caballeronia hypogeia]|uniref:Uncharacterized protein n=1 Tax=Caballeronia hypogeia TaxID=1777140 RepID=A0A157Z4Q9_9BURK|nr:hypothetical protein AWB79_00226 [Caballeronia hypogeia]